MPSSNLPDVEIRSAIRADFTAIARLQTRSWQKAYRNHLPASYLNRRVQIDLEAQWQTVKILPSDVVLVARSKKTGQLLGFVSVWCRPDAYIDNLHCDPGQTGRGIGTALMQAAFQALRSKGRSSASLSVLVGNDRARRFYLRLGGRAGVIRREEIFGYPTDTELIHWDHISL